VPFLAMGAVPLRTCCVCLANFARQGHSNCSKKLVFGAVLLPAAFRAYKGENFRFEISTTPTLPSPLDVLMLLNGPITEDEGDGVGGMRNQGAPGLHPWEGCSRGLQLTAFRSLFDCTKAQ
jgi:hypothetical protein